MEANGGGEGLEDGGDHALANGGGHGLANHAPANGGGHAPAANGGGHALPNGLANGGGHALANGLANGGDQVPAMEAGGAVGNGGLNHGQVMLAPNGVVLAEAVAAGVNPALSLVFLSLPAQEIARCRTVCRSWRTVTGSEAFRRVHCEHRRRTPMPLFFFEDPDLVRYNLRAVDIGGRVSRPVFRFARPADPHDYAFRIHGSCGGILLLSSGARLYACNPCTRRWAHLPPLHADNDIVGFYVSGVYQGDFRCHVLYHDRQDQEPANCAYRIFTLSAAALIGRPNFLHLPDLDLVLAKGIRPSYKIPPIFVANFLHWLPQAGLDNVNVLMFDTFLRTFAWTPPPTIHVNGEEVPAVGGQLFGIHDERIAMTVISPARVDVWARCNLTQAWDHLYSILLPVDVINLHDGYNDDGSLAAGVFAVAQDRNALVQCPRILLQCNVQGDVLQSYQLADHRTFLSRYTIEESLRLHPHILPMQDGDAVDGDPPFFQNQ